MTDGLMLPNMKNSVLRRSITWRSLYFHRWVMFWLQMMQ